MANSRVNISSCLQSLNCLRLLEELQVTMRSSPLKGGRRHFKPKVSIGRWTILALFTLSMVFLYLMVGDGWRAVGENSDTGSEVTLPGEQEGFGPISTWIQSNDQEGLSPTPAVSQSGDQEQFSPTPIVSQFGDQEGSFVVVPTPTASIENSSISQTDSSAAPSVEAISPTLRSSDKCDGRRVYIYELAAEFNELILRNCTGVEAWYSMCDDIINQGFGVPLQIPESDPMASILQPPSAWFRTDQFTIEITFHERLKIHPCRTTNTEEASLFYIPFYHGIDLIKNLYNTDFVARDRLTLLFIKWLRSQKPWQRYQGKRHVLVLGRIVWDFIRDYSKDKTWGSSLLTHPELTNVTKLLIERDIWKDDTLGVPYPTSFHPSSESDLRAWQRTVRTFKRHKFVSLAGATRDNKLTGLIRDAVFEQCANSSRCHSIACNDGWCKRNPQVIVQMGLESVFCLQPPGDSPTRKGIFDSLQTGCIPVVFNRQQAALQYLSHLPGNHSDYSVIVSEEDVCDHNYDIMNHLSRIPLAEVARMQANVVNLIPRLLYRNTKLTGDYTSMDAIDVAMGSLLTSFDAEKPIAGASS
ncbi:probable xyloglucan galactosyltransferase GT17 [Physcomitrium patens]|uniref:Exostosin GT47 domain-containing protein n=1 Tax=Physcomitrium patens TaxID=3218 RepID=A0A2K1IND5_PHYPA|nr:xyloglucan galactosyltransferase XLT2-like [Physcomitrium patens]XP_024361368.1 xyloglucan galactosyltransferase XLT2-like [Physcomitrium patens]XP_024361369.1 xyloglucan galactosyltransferase XLT2-like [Physcomitrium patens]XP_024361370.1 xyloglucan galactosyltransferase XLT2-like [Physcomitrium patens]XP_024361371.1 xyloglucan galactosyltransferase XLT2-like [Physcomitrium patens]XP_024361372.1 xyloglucan galactosyltransferase XLT2-like [Physcomitrium patens]XP_024361373.1 xyloglucan gal|eukprot:XP_024361367.1 xyloglucan galactosyltransferase XLT2-like [Physcomitrella patens]